MSYYWDQFETNPLHAHEREERRDAAQFADYGSCHRHDYVSDKRGGGVCVDCGDTIGAHEL